MHRAVIAIFVCLITSAIMAEEDSFIRLTPEQIGEAYCLSQTGNDVGLITGLLSTGLKAAIDGAQARSDAIEKKNPGEKPPLGDGVPWHSYADYAPICHVTDIKPDAVTGKTALKLNYEFPDYPDANFADTIILIKTENDVLRIDDLQYADGMHIRPALERAFEGCN